MTSGDQQFVAGPVPRVPALSAGEFLRDHRGRSPVVVTGGAAHTRACLYWDPEYLAARCGAAELELLVRVYEPGAIERGYAGEGMRRTDLASFVRDLAAGRAGTGYLFNTDQAVFRVSDDPQLCIGRALAPNPALAPLSAEFELPGFVDGRELLYCALFLGCSHDKSPLHYDLGGEGKLLVQLRGRKRVLLFPPEQARSFYLRGLFEPARYPHDSIFVARTELARPDLERFPELAQARGLEAVLAPGDVLYWPPYWFHDFTNLDDPTFAAVAVLEELRLPALLFREVLDGFGRQLLTRLRARGQTPSRELVAAFEELEGLLLAPESVRKSSLWRWFHRTLEDGR